MPTLLDHLKELQGRLFTTVLVFLLIAAAAYPFFGMVTEFLMAPLKEGQELVYLTPGGAFGFILKVCAYIGLVGVLPVLIFHVYRFLMPAVRQVLLRTVLAYTFASFVLAVAGIAFAYYISLPAALQFLTGFNLNHINPMLTIDSYFSFIMTYMLAGALLFQLPLIMLIINSAKPLTPSKLMKAQGKILLGSFIIAAAISPTPDAVNQAILASPMVVMYQFGIGLVALVNYRQKRAAKAQVVATKQPAPVAAKQNTLVFASQAAAVPEQVAERPLQPVRPQAKAMDIIGGRGPARQLRPVAVPPRSQPPRLVLPERPEPPADMPSLGMRSIDGILRISNAT